MISRLVLLLAALLLCSCMRPVPHDPDLQFEFDRRPENLTLEFTTDKGGQVAYYLPPYDRPELPPEKIVIMYPGINSIALEWLRSIRLTDTPKTGYLLIDYPGRGRSEGVMRPEKNYENSLGALKAVAEHYGKESLSVSFRLLGHSFGTGMALQFAAMENVDSIVLVAPFTDLKEAVKLKSWFLSVIMPSQVDNRLLIEEILAREDAPKISILHGRQDTVLPFSMGEELAEVAPEWVDFYPSADHHITILTSQRELIFKLLLED